MTRLLRYLSHPQVVIDADVPVGRWPLNAEGHARLVAIGDRAWLGRVTRSVSSTETKAMESAAVLVEALGLTAEIRTEFHENDRSATGFLPPEEFERVADAFFAEPDLSVRGWETARAAQARIVRATEEVLAGHSTGDLLLVGHGAVGALLWCHLADRPISRSEDQRPGGGCVWTFDLDSGLPVHPWRPVEEI